MKKLVVLSVLITILLARIYFDKPKYRDGDKIRITTQILVDPIDYEDSQYLNISGLKVYLSRYPEISYGDKIVLEGLVQKGKLTKPELVKVMGSENFLFRTRQRVVEFYKSNLPEPMAGLTAGVVLGDKAALTGDFWDTVKKVGVAHVVVASGTNITFVISFLTSFLAIFMSRKKMIYFVVLGIILYVTVSGFQAPIIRAAIMASALFVAQLTGRLTSGWRVLAFTGYSMLLFNPQWTYDIGFILSFTSTASIMLFSGKIDKSIKFLPGFIRESVATSAAAQIGVAPILFVTFGQFYIWSILVNALVLWTIPYIMVFGFIGGVGSLMSPFLGRILLFLGYPAMWWFVKVTEIFR